MFIDDVVILLVVWSGCGFLTMMLCCCPPTPPYSTLASGYTLSIIRNIETLSTIAQEYSDTVNIIAQEYLDTVNNSSGIFRHCQQ